MKAKTKLSKRLPTGQFLNAMLEVMKNWSMDRTSHLVDNLGQLVENQNLKTFKFVPKITNEDYLAAYEWNQLRKQVRFMKSSGVYIVKAHKPTQESDLTISNDECSAYLTAIEADDEPIVSVSIPKKRGRPSTQSQSKKPRKQ
jgi:hypothetical protein